MAHGDTTKEIAFNMWSAGKALLLIHVCIQKRSNTKPEIVKARSGLAFTTTPNPLSTFLLVQNDSLFSAGSCGGGFCKAKMDPHLQLAGMTEGEKMDVR